MVSAGPIGFGIIFFLLTVLSAVILPLWIIKGSGETHIRKIMGGSCLLALIICWIIMLASGGQSNLGIMALLAGVVVSIFSLFLPSIYNSVIRKHENT